MRIKTNSKNNILTLSLYVQCNGCFFFYSAVTLESPIHDITRLLYFPHSFTSIRWRRKKKNDDCVLDGGYFTRSKHIQNSLAVTLFLPSLSLSLVLLPPRSRYVWMYAIFRFACFSSSRIAIQFIFCMYLTIFHHRIFFIVLLFQFQFVFFFVSFVDLF